MGSQVALEAVLTSDKTAERFAREITSLRQRVTELESERKALSAKAAELDAANLRLSELTVMDPLTEVLNRRGLQQALSRSVKQAKRRGTRLTAMLVDLDDFKRINDELGHAVGDGVLREVAAAVAETIRVSDYVGRIGGDEFLVLLPHTTLRETQAVAERVRLAIANARITLQSQRLQVTASLGVCSIHPGLSSVDELLSQLHLVLQRSKAGGKNRVSYREVTAERAVPRSRDDSVIDALRRGESFRVVSQPIYRLNSGTTRVAVELLTRTDIPEVSMPRDFLSAALDANILTVVDRLCFRACLGASRKLNHGLSYHLNLLPSTLVEIPVQHLLNEFPEEREKKLYCVEISAQRILGAPTYLEKAIGELKLADIRIAIDQVGFGRSSLETLLLLQPDLVKIDRKSFAGADRDPERLAVLRRLLRVADALDAEVIAKGVETNDELDVLRDLGVAYAQGYLWGMPA